MHCSHLSLSNFRNYVRLELDLPPGVVLLYGDNAQGKSNLLEAVFFLATTRSPRTSNDRELINWLALEEKVPASRVAAQVHTGGGNLRVEIGMMVREMPPGNGVSTLSSSLGKRIRVNGIAQRALDFIGRVNVVMFSPGDIDLVAGAPAVRRRYLDITNSQVDPRYVRALQQYNRVVLQRNHLLRLIRERQAHADQLPFWDDQLVEAGCYLVRRRQRTVSTLNDLLWETHARLTGNGERLRVTYACNLLEADAAADRVVVPPAPDVEERALAEVFRAALRQQQGREIAQGSSLVGPHRDDLRFTVDGVDMSVYGSRGQQRTIALSLKLAEAQFMEGETGERPILLLDDVLSELDARRRRHLLAGIAGAQQVLITTADLERYDAEFLARADLYQIDKGRVQKVDVTPASLS